jgi:hypothetical protein
MIKSITGLIAEIKKDLATWDNGTKPWFRGESGDDPPLCPKIAAFEYYKENYLLQSFRRKAGGLANVPDREHTDMWLFLAQHYGVPTRLLDWTEGALHALYFAINQGKVNPRLYMLNARKINDLAGVKTNLLNYPLSFGVPLAPLYIALAWQNRDIVKIKQPIKELIVKNSQNQPPDQIEKELDAIDKLSLKIPIAFPATYQDQRMIAQRSCFTIHGEDLKPIKDILNESNVKLSECLFEYSIDIEERNNMLDELYMLGISASTIFPDLDHLAIDLRYDINGLKQRAAAKSNHTALFGQVIF